jgi:hypothetical protein
MVISLSLVMQRRRVTHTSALESGTTNHGRCLLSIVGGGILCSSLLGAMRTSGSIRLPGQASTKHTVFDLWHGIYFGNLGMFANEVGKLHRSIGPVSKNNTQTVDHGARGRKTSVLEPDAPTIDDLAPLSRSEFPDHALRYVHTAVVQTWHRHLCDWEHWRKKARYVPD